MGTLEKAAKKRRTKENVQNAVLGIVAAAGVITASAIALPLLAGIAGIAKQSGYRIRYQAKTAAGRLTAKGLLKYDRGRRVYEITDAGHRRIALEHARTGQPARAKRHWDKRYRLVMFDIPEKRRNLRRRLRALMTDFGFLRLQDSVWISPYDCEDLIALVKAELHIGKDVLYAVVDQLEHDTWVRAHFKLP